MFSNNYILVEFKKFNKEDYNIKGLFVYLASEEYNLGVHSSRLTTVIELNAIKSFTTCVDEAPREPTLIYANDKPEFESQLITYFE